MPSRSGCIFSFSAGPALLETLASSKLNIRKKQNKTQSFVPPLTYIWTHLFRRHFCCLEFTRFNCPVLGPLDLHTLSYASVSSLLARAQETQKTSKAHLNCVVRRGDCPPSTSVPSLFSPYPPSLAPASHLPAFHLHFTFPSFGPLFTHSLSRSSSTRLVAFDPNIRFVLPVTLVDAFSAFHPCSACCFVYSGTTWKLIIQYRRFSKQHSLLQCSGLANILVQAVPSFMLA